MASEAPAARDRKRHGRHYTPPVLARFLAGRLLAHVPRPEAGVLRVLDPACGDGELLFALRDEVARRLPGIRVELTGYDLDATALAVARGRPEGIGVDWHAGDFLTVAAELRAGSFDAVITNPPYVRTQQLGGVTAQLLSKQFGLRGRIDLTHPFVATLPRLLCSGGVLGLLCANRFLTTKAGANIRRLLLAELTPVELYDLGDTKLFEAAVLPAITIATRGAGGGGCRYVSAYETEGDEKASETDLFEALTGEGGCLVAHNGRTFAVAVGTLVTSHAEVAVTQMPSDVGAASVGEWVGSGRQGSGDLTESVLQQGGIGSASVPRHPSEPQSTPARTVLRRTQEPEAAWRMSNAGVDAWLAGIAAATWRTFGEVARIRVGIKTTADRVFISDRWSEVEPAPEPELLLDLITHHDLAPWRIARLHDTRVLYPYDRTRPNRTPIDLAEFPCAAEYLRSHKDTLAARHYLGASGREWFEIWVPQRPHLWCEPKLVFPDISERPRFALDRSGAVVNGDCYWISLPDLANAPGDAEQLAYLLMGVANSALGLRFYDAVCGNRLYSGRRRWITQYVSRLPLPDPESARSADVIELAREFVDGRTLDETARADLDERVAAAFGMASGADVHADHGQQGPAGELAGGVPVGHRDEPVGGEGQREREAGHDLGDQVGVEIVGVLGVP
ncbi:Eco57I restriction-modification methylase domain-containing protein [Nocardia iowensis]|uniref:Eco57I restriction-modification methylase domain-containing protein n=1 Tax=Nocardia iowensis TaxID=204891 RepID=UPI001FE9A7F7|nr:methyltransferase domain-containing protein [Nocardia iowensis]